MEPNYWSTKYGVSEETDIMLGTLIKRKRELDKLERLRFLYSTGAFVFLGLTFLYSYTHVFAVSRGQMMRILASLADVRLVILIAVSVSLYIRFKNVSASHKSKKEKYDKLRGETIDKLTVPWIPNDKSRLKDTMAAELQSQHKVNITHLN